MAIPNLLSLTTVNAHTFQANLTGTTTTALITNSAASGQSYLIKSITVANYDTSAGYKLTLGIVKSGGSFINLANTVVVPFASTLTFPGACPFYLEEGDVIEGGADTTLKLAITIGYLVMS